jgi:hypothetical protein
MNHTEEDRYQARLSAAEDLASMLDGRFTITAVKQIGDQLTYTINGIRVQVLVVSAEKIS